MMQFHEPSKESRFLVHVGMTKGAAIAVLILTVAVIGGFWRIETLVGNQKQSAKRNQMAIQTLCARQHTLLDVLVAGIAIVTAERQDPGVPDATHRADDIFIDLFNKDLADVQADFLNPESACYGIERSG